MSTTNPFNPFANVDFSKFDMSKFDITKMMGDVKIPGFDVQAIMDAQRKNIEALNAANQTAVQGMQAVAQRQAEILTQAMNEISVGRLFGQMLTVARMFEMEAQPHLLLLHKTMITAEGVGRNLNPNMNMWQLSEPLIRAWAEEHRSPRARLKAHAKEVVEILRDAPRILQKLKELLNKAEA